MNEVSSQSQSDIRDINQLYNCTSTEASSNLRICFRRQLYVFASDLKADGLIQHNLDQSINQSIRADALQDVEDLIRELPRIKSYVT